MLFTNLLALVLLLVLEYPTPYHMLTAFCLSNAYCNLVLCILEAKRNLIAITTKFASTFLHHSALNK